jgi:hypothetical protein
VPDVAVEVGTERIGMLGEGGVRTDRAAAGEKEEKKEAETDRRCKT